MNELHDTAAADLFKLMWETLADVIGNVTTATLPPTTTSFRLRGKSAATLPRSKRSAWS